MTPQRVLSYHLPHSIHVPPIVLSNHTQRLPDVTERQIQTKAAHRQPRRRRSAALRAAVPAERGARRSEPRTGAAWPSPHSAQRYRAALTGSHNAPCLFASLWTISVTISSLTSQEEPGYALPSPPSRPTHEHRPRLPARTVPARTAPAPLTR